MLIYAFLIIAFTFCGCIALPQVAIELWSILYYEICVLGDAWAEDSATRLDLVLRLLLPRQLSLLIKVSQCVEEPENFWL